MKKEKHINCPICDMSVRSYQLDDHFRTRSDSHPQFSEWNNTTRRVNQIENIDYVRCAICGETKDSLSTHLSKVHGITAAQYKKQYGKPVVSEAVRKYQSKNSNNRKPRRLTKEVPCASCGEKHTVNKITSLYTHKLLCLDCRGEEENAKWEGQVEGVDFVKCQECGYRTCNLHRHVQKNHPGYLEKYPNVIMRVLKPNPAKNFSKTDFIPFEISLGLIDAHVMSDKLKIKVGSLKSRAKQLGLAYVDHRSEACSITLTREDFEPFKTESGEIDTKKMKEQLKMSARVIMRGLAQYDLKRLDYAAISRQSKRLQLTVKDFEPFFYKNGTVAVCRAAKALGHSKDTTRKYCIELGLKPGNGPAKQYTFLDALRELLGVSYQDEWFFPKSAGAKERGRYRADGFFKDLNLIVEFHGYYHTVFPSQWITDPLKFAERQEVDCKKRELALAYGFKHLEIYESDPYLDEGFLTEKLRAIGIEVLPVSERPLLKIEPPIVIPVLHPPRSDNFLFVTCVLCGKTGVSLSRHVGLKHQITPKQYTSLYGQPVESLEYGERHLKNIRAVSEIWRKSK